MASLLQHPLGSTHPGPTSSAALQSSWHLCGQARAWLFPHSPWTLTLVPDCRSSPARKAVSPSSTSHSQTHSSLNPRVSCQLTRVKGPGDLGILITHGAAALVMLWWCVFRSLREWSYHLSGTTLWRQQKAVQAQLSCFLPHLREVVTHTLTFSSIKTIF